MEENYLGRVEADFEFLTTSLSCMVFLNDGVRGGGWEGGRLSSKRISLENGYRI